jgi:hypothetical protein
MRNFILAASAAYPTAVPLTAAGQVSISYLNNGAETLVKDAATAAGLKDRGMITWKNPNSELGQIVFPFYKKDLSYSVSAYAAAATTFLANFTIPSVEASSDYTVIIVKNGVKFNERNKWTSTIHAGKNDTVKNVADKIAAHINANTVGSGVSAVSDTKTEGKITITAKKAGQPYTIVLADELQGLAVTTTTAGLPAINDAAAIKEMANKAAADAGFEYTYDEFAGLYPAYPLNPLAQPDKADTGFTVYTIRFAEPRDMKTRDEVVHQIIQIAYPTGSAAIATLKTILDALV